MRHTGLIAQEVEGVFPGWVGESDGHKFLTEMGATALLIEALRELRAETDLQITHLRAAHEQQHAPLIK